MNIFLSYATADLAAKNRVRLRLRAEELPVWDDRHFVRVGDRLDRRLEAALRDSGVFLLLWSEAAERSRWVRNELAYFQEIDDGCAADRLVLPLRLDGTPLPLRCASLRHFWTEEGKIANSAWEEILESIRRNSLVI